MDKIEEKAFEAFPDPVYELWQIDLLSREFIEREDLAASSARNGFMVGYNQAKKEMIKKATEWWETHGADYHYCNTDYIPTEVIEDFKKAMEE